LSLRARLKIVTEALIAPYAQKMGILGTAERKLGSRPGKKPN